MKKLLLLSIIIFGILGFSYSQINIKNKLKRKTEQRADRKTDQSIDKGLDEVEEGGKEGITELLG